MRIQTMQCFGSLRNYLAVYAENYPL